MGWGWLWGLCGLCVGAGACGGGSIRGAIAAVQICDRTRPSKSTHTAEHTILTSPPAPSEINCVSCQYTGSATWPAHLQRAYLRLNLHQHAQAYQPPWNPQRLGRCTVSFELYMYSVRSAQLCVHWSLLQRVLLYARTCLCGWCVRLRCSCLCL